MLEVLYDELSGKWYAHIPVEVDWKPPSRTAEKKASLDLGICNLATLYIEGERPVIFSGRAVNRFPQVLSIDKKETSVAGCWQSPCS